MISVFEKREDCCGCTACKLICPVNAIVMVQDDEGFLYPKIEQDKCTDCGLCKEVCAFQNGYDIAENEETPMVYAAKYKDEIVRLSSTSGGVFTAISDYILDNKGIVYGVAYDKDFNVVHIKASSKEERERIKGSKYVQSDLKNTFSEIKELLIKGKTILFTGTPCQTAGLKRFLKGTESSKLFLCDIVCHGVPSPKLWKEHKSDLQIKANSKIQSYSCRSKINGWHCHDELIVYTNGKIDYQSSISQRFKLLFYSNRILRPSCYQCKYTNFKRPSDITIADFWGIEKWMPSYDDNKGVSLILVNTKKGISLFGDIKNNLLYIESNTTNCLQRNLVKPTPMPKDRLEFWNDYHKYGFECISNKYGGCSLKSRIKKILKKLI